MSARYAVIGNPVAHSLSPLMHNSWMRDHQLDAVYERIQVDGGDDAFIDFIRSAGLAGANVTVPFKTAAYRAADIKPAHENVANVLTWSADESLRADNTDGDGFLASLDDAAPGWRAERVLIVGAGGAAAGIAQALLAKRAPAQLVIANRSRDRADALIDSLGQGKAADWAALPDLFAEADLIVQTTTLGMHGGPAMDWPAARCKAGALAVDIVYRPLRTPFLKAAAAAGLKTVDGLGMLIHQGALAFEIWFGIKPDVQAARERLTAVLGEEA